MPQITHMGRVMVPVSDQDKAIAFYTDTLGFSRRQPTFPSATATAGSRIGPPAGGAAVALVPSRGEYAVGRMTGIAFDSSDPRADHAELQAKGVDVDADLMGGDGTVPLLFMFRDLDGNHLMLVDSQ